MSLLLILAVCSVLHILAKGLKIPALLLYLVTGIIMGPYFLNLLSPIIIEYSAFLRNLALVIILLRSGLSLSLKSLMSMGKETLLMSFLPGLFEGIVIAILSVIFLNFTFIEGGMLGFIIAAVSPAVVVPFMIKLQEEGIGSSKGIPSLILASASLDDVVAITIFTVFSSFYFGSTTSPLLMILLIPVKIGVGIILGYLLGKIFSYLKNFPSFVILLIALGLSYIKILPGLVIIMAFGLGIQESNRVISEKTSHLLKQLWFFAQMILFVLVGASFDPSLAQTAGLMGILIITIGMAFRSVGVFLSLHRSGLSPKERLFCMIAYLPKATVQAAMGAVPLSLGVSSGSMILSLSILAIMISTPLGSLLMNLTYKKLLV